MKTEQIIVLISQIRVIKAKILRFFYDNSAKLKIFYIFFLILAIITLILNNLIISIISLSLSFVIYHSPPIIKKELLKMGQTANQNMTLFSWEYTSKHSDFKTLRKIREVVIIVIFALIVINLRNKRLF